MSIRVFKILLFLFDWTCGVVDFDWPVYYGSLYFEHVKFYALANVMLSTLHSPEGKLDHFGYFGKNVPGVSLGCLVVQGGYLKSKIGSLPKFESDLIFKNKGSIYLTDHLVFLILIFLYDVGQFVVCTLDCGT